MKKIININFHSRVVPIEETAYEILQQYIESLRRHFANEEGRDEIISDIENRIAELFSETLKKGAACITDDDVNAIITSMGRPEDFGDEEPAAAAAGQGTYSQEQQSSQYTSSEPRRLYRSDNDKILGGVCAGLASYMGIDSAIMRIIFILITFGWGAGFLLYIILWVVLPTKTLPPAARKRLYRNRDDRVIAGVASGLAAYFHIDVWIPRLIFALPMILSVLTSIFRHIWFDWDSPAFITGGFGGTLFISYIILWVILPEATSASEKLEMRGEKVDIESIKNTIKSDLDSFAKKAGNVGAEMKSTFQKTGEQVKQSTQNFASEAYPAARRTGSGIGRAIGVLFKAFFLFIAGLIAFCLIMVLISLVFRGPGILTIKNYILTGFWQNFLAWASFFLFLVIPVIALLTWLIRRITGVRSRQHYLGYTFFTFWVIGLFCTIALAGVIMNNFRSRQHVEEELTLSRPSHNKLIVKATEGKHDYFDGDWWFDFNWDRDTPFYNLNDDSFVLNTVRVNLVKSEDSSYRVKLLKFSHGSDGHIARQLAEQIRFSVQQTDSILYLPQGFTVSRNQKFRNQQVLVVVSIPVGKKIYVSHTVDQYSWFNVDVHNSHIRWNKRKNWDDDWGREWEDDVNIGSQYGWSKDVEYIMTGDGLVRTDRRKVDNDDRDDRKEEKKNDENKNSDEDPGYRYHTPKSTRPAPTADTVKKTAALHAVTDAHLYLLSALFQ
ncbi:MAG: PspC domain-containing protein [Chitinophagaceae bacterium]|nr:PspC domain-containing protein [Chitinophagaceae bacterium]